MRSNAGMVSFAAALGKFPPQGTWNMRLKRPEPFHLWEMGHISLLRLVTMVLSVWETSSEVHVGNCCYWPGWVCS